MTKKILSLTVKIALLNFSIFFAVALFSSKGKKEVILGSTDTKPTEVVQNNIPATPTSVVATEPEKKKDLFSELNLHNSPSDCWVSYQGHIYDLTSFFGQHPGGDAVLSHYCGSDMMQGFQSKEKDPPVAHSETAVRMLQQYLIQ